MSQIVPGHLVSGQVVTAAQVINSAGGQVVMSNNGIVGGQIVGDQLVVSHHQQHLQQLQAPVVSNATMQSQQNAVLQPQQVMQQQVVTQQGAMLHDSANVISTNTMTHNIVQNHQMTAVPMSQQPPTQAIKMTAVPTPAASVNSEPVAPVINKSRLTDLVRDVDPTEQLDEEVEDVLLAIADDFIESSVNAACRLAKHRGARTLDVRDLHMYLERNWHMWIPGFGTEELRPYKRAPTTEAHKQRMALIRKAVKKY